jgi:hypothetical protein
MLATFDLDAVRHFTRDLRDKRSQCDNGEGMVCSNLQESIKRYVELCQELRTAVNEWVRAIFTGQAKFDPDAETLLKTELQHLLNRAKQIAALGRAMNWQCFELQGLHALHYFVADFDYLLENWVRPQLSVSPSPRVKISGAAEQQISERIGKLPSLASDWRPTDQEHLVRFQNQRAIQP